MPSKDVGSFGAQQLLKDTTALPLYNELPFCPSCRTDAPPMAMIGGSLTNMCSICSKDASGNDSADTWAMPGHACGVCMAVMCAACNQELEVHQKTAEAEQAVREDLEAQQAPLEVEVTAATHYLSMASAELAAEVANRSQGQAAANAEAASMRADAAKMRATAARERAQLGKSLTEVRSNLEKRRADLLEAEAAVATALPELRELAQAEAAAEERMARKAACGELVDARTRKAELREDRVRLEAEAEDSSVSLTKRLHGAEQATRSAAALRCDLEEVRQEKALIEALDKCALADARAELDAHTVRRSEANPAEEMQPFPSAAVSANDALLVVVPEVSSSQQTTTQDTRTASTAALVAPAAAVQPPAPQQTAVQEPKPRGLRKFWGEVKGGTLWSKDATGGKLWADMQEAAKEVKNITKELAETLETFDPGPTEIDRGLGSSSASRAPIASGVGANDATSAGSSAPDATASSSSSSSAGRQGDAPRRSRPLSADSEPCRETTELRDELRRALRVCQEHTAAQLAQMNEVHGQLTRVSTKASELNAEVQECKAKQQRHSARRGQLRAELAAGRREARQKQALLTAQLNEASHLYRQRVQAVLSTLPSDTDQAMAAANAQLTSIGAALLDDCDSATGWHET